MNLVVAITGASGALYAQRLLQGLSIANIHTHLIISPLGRRLLHDELGLQSPDPSSLTGLPNPPITPYNYNDVGAKLASGSFLHDGMVICPCSSNTLNQIAHGLSDNLISRAAAVTLKERRPLILAHREMPLSPIDINAYKLLSDAGAILAPCNPGFYLNPTSLPQIADFVAGKLLDLLKVPHNFPIRWDPNPAR
ncbi:MAG TPA: UbiX family flavin prenyltransferase [Tepidisphaeraceae bacterium]|jgi:4-hydroxy-3-polyprenylbenzoate decarboxylase|nr:UbiX family flavin prenyltransferase [Tepidisphaeraceae bacterium]